MKTEPFWDEEKTKERLTANMLRRERRMAGIKPSTQGLLIFLAGITIILVMILPR